MRRVIRISSLLAALLLISGNVLAAGLGRMSVSSALGQPLRAQIELLAVSPEDIGSIEAKLASPEAYQQAHIERPTSLAGLNLSVEKGADGKPVVVITSSAPVNDPFVDLLVELDWNSGRVMREYTVLLDPAAPKQAEAVQPAVPTVAPEVSAESALPPATAPAAEAKAPAKSVAAAPKTYGPVKGGETLHAIASKVLPPDVSMNVMLASLYHANPDAFIHHNMNLLKKGQVLSVPDRDSVMLMYSPHQANKLVREQNAAWRAIQNRIAEQAGQAMPGPGKQTSAEAGKIEQAKPQETPTAPPASKDVLKLSKGEPVQASAEAGKRVRDLEEELVAKDRALQEAQSRVGELQKTVQDLQKLAELKGQAEANKPATEEAGPAVSPEPVKPVVKPVAKPPVAPPPMEEPPSFLGSLMANPLYIVGGVAALILVALLWVFMVSSRRRKRLSNFEQSVMTGGDQFKTSIFKTSPGAPTDKAGVTQSGATTDFSRLGLGSIDTHEVDPIAEAEVYMAYGRDAQAEEILLEALKKEPQRHEIAGKLLEIYAARHDRASFETQASELYAALGDPGRSEWQKAAELGRSIDPDNPLYRVYSEVPEIPEPAPASSEAEPTAEAEEAPETVAELTPMAGLEPLEFEPAAHEEKIEPAEEESSEVAAMALDFEPEEVEQIPTFHLEEPAEQGEATTTFPAFGKTGDTGSTEEEEIHLGAPEPMQVAELEVAGPEAEQEKVKSEAAVELPDLDFSGIDLELAEEPTASAQPAETEAPIELEMPAEVEMAPAEAEAPAAIDPELLEEVNTKLDLAKAYLEMGDKEGAREILTEVLKEGDSQQREKADALIAEIG